jgi:RND family efflux transporter MFP subunit
MMSRSRKPLVALIAIALGIGLGIASRLRAHAALAEDAQTQARPVVNTLAPSRATHAEVLTLPGEVRAFVDAPVYARTSGYVLRWRVDLGATVRAGELLAELDTPEVDAQFRQAEADLATAEANLALAQTTRARWAELVGIQAVSQQEFEEKAGDLLAKSATRNAAKENVAHFRQLQDFKRVVAPFSGTVTARNVDIGDLVESGTGATAGGSRELFHLIDASKLRVYVDVPQGQTAALRPGVEAEVVLPERPGEPYLGRVVRTAGAIAPGTRTLRVEVDVDNPAGTLLGGSYAEVRFKVPPSATLRLPVNTLLFRGDGLRVAAVSADERVRLLPVTLGRDFGTEVEVLAGLDGSEAVVVNPPDGIREGDPVRVVQRPSPAVGPAK